MEPHTGLNYLDYAVLGIVFLSGILALFRGFVREIFSLIAWTAAYFVAAKYHALVEPFVHHYIKNEQATVFAAGIGLFCVTLIVLTIVGSVVSNLIKGQALSAIDRSLGFIFGLVRGGLIVCIIYLAALLIFWPNTDKPTDEQNKDKNKPPDWVMEAKTQPALAYGAEMLKVFIPQSEIDKSKKSTQEYIEQEYAKQKAAVQKAVEQQELDKLSTPTVPGAKGEAAPTYDDKSRSGLDELINQKGKP